MRDFEAWPIFWARGLMPKEWQEPQSKPSSVATARTFEIGMRSSMEEMPLQLWGTDGSGGKYGNAMHLMRCGWGAACTRPNPMHPSVVYGMYGDLPSYSDEEDSQTVPRAEIHALIQAVSIEDGVDKIIYVDSEHVVTGANSKEKAMKSANMDLWEKHWSLVEQQRCTIMVRRVKAHRDDEYLLSRPSEICKFLANRAADWLADQDAALHEVSRADAARSKMMDEIGTQVRQRMLCIAKKVCELDDLKPSKKARAKSKRGPKRKTLEKEYVPANLRHCVRRRGAGEKCWKCGQFVYADKLQ